MMEKVLCKILELLSVQQYMQPLNDLCPLIRKSCHTDGGVCENIIY